MGQLDASRARDSSHSSVIYHPLLQHVVPRQSGEIPAGLQAALASLQVALSGDGSPFIKVTPAWIADWWFITLEGRGVAHIPANDEPCAKDYICLTMTLSGRSRASGIIALQPGPGQMTVTPWTSSSGLLCAGEFKYVFAFLPRAAFPADRGGVDNLPFLRPISTISGAGAVLCSAIRTLANETASKNAHPSLAASLPALAALTADVFSHNVAQSGAGAASSDQLARITDYLETHLKSPDLCADSVASACGLSKRKLFRLFEKDGRGFADVLRQMRVDRACDLLAYHPELTLGEIASATGFSALGHFSRTFRAEMECTPTDYRRRHLSYQQIESDERFWDSVWPAETSIQ